MLILSNLESRCACIVGHQVGSHNLNSLLMQLHIPRREEWGEETETTQVSS